MNNRFMIRTLILIFLCSVVAALWTESARRPAEAYAAAYVCPPCGCDKDKTEFDKSGTCPVCGMALVEKGTAASVPTITRDTPRKRVAILIFDGVQIIDYTGPWEVFGEAGFEVFTVAQKPDPITTAFGMKVMPNYTFSEHPKPDVLLIPGGNVLDAQKNPPTLEWIQEKSRQADVVLSVCNGAYILAKAGLLTGLKATTTASLIDGLANAAPGINVVYDQRFVDNGKIITSGGLSSGIDGALHVIEKFFGRGTAQRVALGMEYNWDPESKFSRAALADRYMRFLYDVDGAQILSSSGSREQWENKWLITSELPASQILEKVNESIASGKTYGAPLRVKWLRARDGNDQSHSAWSFTDERGKIWRGFASVEPAPSAKNKYVMSVRVTREPSEQLGSKPSGS